MRGVNYFRRQISLRAHIYDDRSYFRRPGENERPPWVGPEDPRRLVGGMFFVDGYEYPPPFLVLPMTMIALGADFLQARTVWFAFQVALVVSAFLIVAFHIGGEVGMRFGLLAPVVYLAIPMQTGLQWGNFQPGTVALALIAMVAMSRKREVLGAILLGFVVLAKLFPGILLLVLAARRQWRALSLTVCAMAAWSAVAVAVLGPEPFVDFVRFHLPRMASGEAFGMLHVPFVAALNHSVYGLPLKLRFFGIDHGSFASSATLAWLYTIVPCAVALVLGRRLGPISAWTRSSAEVVLWICVIMLANLSRPIPSTGICGDRTDVAGGGSRRDQTAVPETSPGVCRTCDRAPTLRALAAPGPRVNFGSVLRRRTKSLDVSHRLAHRPCCADGYRGPVLYSLRGRCIRCKWRK